MAEEIPAQEKPVEATPAAPEGKRRASQPTLADALDYTPEELLLGTKEKTPEPETEPEPEPAGLPDHLLHRAAEAGLTESEVKEYGADSAQLGKALDLIDRQLARQYRSLAKQSEQKEPVKEEPPAWDLAKAWEEELDVQLPGEDEPTKRKMKEAVHPALSKIIDAMHAHYKGQISKLEQAVQWLGGEATRRQQAEQEEFADRLFAEMGEELEPLIGKGPTRKLPANSKARKARDEILADAVMYLNGAEKAGKKVEVTAAFMKKIAKMHEPSPQQKEKEQGEERLRDDDGRFVARPTHRFGREVNHEGEFEKTVREKNLRLAGDNHAALDQLLD